MQIVMYCPGLPFHGATLEEGNSLGGSESAAYYMARALARQGHQVTLFTTIERTQQGSWDGVRYLSCGPRSESSPLGADFEWYAAATPHDLLIIQRVPDAFRRSFASKINLWWAHDLALHRHHPSFAQQLWNVDRVLSVSEFHRAQISEIYKVPAAAICVVPNGIDPTLFANLSGEGTEDDGAETRREEQRKLKAGILTYSSRPERGLERLVGPGGVMEQLLRDAPDLRLQVAGYDNTTAATQPYYDWLWRRCDDLPNVELLGALSKEELAGTLRSAWLHVYPTSFEEVSCITAMETQAAGTPILATRLAALPETLANAGAEWLEPDEAEDSQQVAAAILALRHDPARWRDLRAQSLRKAASYDWDHSARRLMEIAEEALHAKNSDPARLARHFLRHSDVMACRELLALPDHSTAPGLEPVRRELADHYQFVEQDAYADHYQAFAAWQEEHGIDHGHAQPERLLAIPRFQVVADLVALLPEGSRVLDYGCGQGHFTAALAARHPDISFTGVDISARIIDQGVNSMAGRNLSNLTLQSGQVADLTGEYDLVLGLEVLEHVPEPWTLTGQLEQRLAGDGTLCITVPFGPWEAESYRTVPFRTHIHHLERADLLTMFGHKPDYRVIAVPVRFTDRGEALGCYRVTFTQGEEPPLPMDLRTKFNSQAPVETLAVCLVCRDDGAALARTLESVKEIASQIVIGIDGAPDNPGPAWEIAHRYGVECFHLPSPLETGFDAARNATIDRAWADWVLWIDDDEVLEWPQRLVKYLRANSYDAYAIKQHHFAAEPAGVIKTDFPCRLFRNHRDVRFYGIVHEHPELALNQGIGNVMLLPDVAICHNGYETEEIRRRRFHRNLPLMVRDRETYPDRILGKYLWVRDLAHLNRYAMERGEGFGPILESRARQAVALWRELLEQGHLRLALDALPYYSDCVSMLNGDCIQFEISMGAACAGLGGLDRAPPTPVRGNFLHTEDIRLLTKELMRDTTTIFEGKYL